MLDRESACNRVFLARRFVLFGADGVGLRFEPARSFSSWPLPRGSTMSSPLLCATRSRPAPRSMITSERDIVSRAGNATEPSRNSSMISRARGHAGTRAHAQGGVRSECAKLGALCSFLIGVGHWGSLFSCPTRIRGPWGIACPERPQKHQESRRRGPWCVLATKALSRGQRTRYLYDLWHVVLEDRFI